MATGRHLRRLVTALLAAAALAGSGCRSVDKPEPTGEAATGKPAVALTGDASVCAHKPAPPACCEALTPTCNECRADAERATAAWREQCLPPAATPPDCAKPAPVVDCCGDASETCRDCREQALARLMAWKDACADEDAASCDRRPPQDTCCQALIPSCEACRDRNRRVLESWQRRCENP